MMKRLFGSVAVMVALFGTGAAAQQVIDLSGRYVCVQACATGVLGLPAYITQHGWDMNLVNDAGMPSRAWVDWPGHIWIQNFQEGAIYSQDGMFIQFDHGAVWQRDIGLPPPYGR